jgi:hypothetical protein
VHSLQKKTHHTSLLAAREGWCPIFKLPWASPSLQLQWHSCTESTSTGARSHASMSCFIPATSMTFLHWIHKHLQNLHEILLWTWTSSQLRLQWHACTDSTSTCKISIMKILLPYWALSSLQTSMEF